MPRPRALFETGDPITADFPYARWLGDHKRIEEITKVWNKLVIDRTWEIEEWIPAIEKLLKRGLTIYAYFNNHYAGFGPASVRAFSEMWERTSGRTSMYAIRCNCPSARQAKLF